jgi:aldehyde dehydrogenase (NAD+)
VRGALVARFTELVVEHKADLATLVTVEAGKITSEALGEVQEMIDICQFAVGPSRQLYGKTISSERPRHRLMETWHPPGVVGVITAFNFPVAAWSWNTAIALVCGDTVVWKPTELTPLTALACQALIERAASDVGAPRQVSRSSRVVVKSVNSWSTTRGWRSCARPGRCGWVSRSVRGWRSGSAGRCSSWPATTRRL